MQKSELNEFSWIVLRTVQAPLWNVAVSSHCQHFDPAVFHEEPCNWRTCQMICSETWQVLQLNEMFLDIENAPLILHRMLQREGSSPICQDRIEIIGQCALPLHWCGTNLNYRKSYMCLDTKTLKSVSWVHKNWTDSMKPTLHPCMY